MCRAGSASPACLRITIFDKSSKSTGFLWINKERASRAHGPRRVRTQSEEPSPFMSLHCIWSIQPSSIGAVPMIRFSAWHDKCLPASAFVAVKDKTLVVVFPSAEVCNNIMITFTGGWFRRPAGAVLLAAFILFFLSSEGPPIYLLRCVDDVQAPIY